MRPRISDRSIGSTEMPDRLEQLLAEPDGVERRRPGADGADAQAAQPLHHPAHAVEPLAGRCANTADAGVSVCREVSEYGMPYCFRLLQADILPQKLSRRSCDRHRPGSSGVACTSTGTSQVGQAQGVGDRPLLAEVRQRDDHAVDLVAVAVEQLGAPARLLARGHRAVLGGVGAEDDHRHAGAARGRRSSPRARCAPGDRGRTRGCRR